LCTFLFNNIFFSWIKVKKKNVFVLDEFINIDRAASSQENIVVKENSGTFTLSCKVEAYPRKMVYWLRYMGMSDGRETYTGNVLKVHVYSFP